MCFTTYFRTELWERSNPLCRIDYKCALAPIEKKLCAKCVLGYL